MTDTTIQLQQDKDMDAACFLLVESRINTNKKYMPILFQSFGYSAYRPTLKARQIIGSALLNWFQTHEITVSVNSAVL